MKMLVKTIKAKGVTKMHYYSFNIADYKKDTEHLNPIEHYIYRSLIDRYYLDEKPIPLKTQSVMRRLSLVSDDHKQLLTNVLDDFFYKCDDGYRHKRIDAEIEKYQSNAEKNRINGAKGGRPRKDKPKLTQSVTSGIPMETQINPNQEPVTNNQELLTKEDEGNAAAFKLVYENIKNQLKASAILPSDKPVNDKELMPEVYKFVLWCDDNNVEGGRRAKSSISWFQRIDAEERKRFYTFPDEVNRNYYDPADYKESVPVTDEEAAAIRAKYMEAAGF